jgi:hypothetical protein
MADAEPQVEADLGTAESTVKAINEVAELPDKGKE